MSKTHQLQAAITIVASCHFVSTIFFHYVEGWRWLDAFYFSIMTMSTVGYGDFVPVTDLGKIGAIALVMIGMGALAVLVHLYAEIVIGRRAEIIEKRGKKSKNRPPDQI